MHISRCERTKVLGIPMGAPLYKYKDILEQYEVKIFSSNFQLYGDMSRRVMGTLANFSDDIEIYSVDEAFLKFESCDSIDLIKHVRNIKETVRRWAGTQYLLA
jgi:DNA polymerase V